MTNKLKQYHLPKFLITFIIISLLLCSCSNNKNEMMTVFLNKQKSINDLKNNAKNKSDGFMRIRLETMDTLVHDVNYKDPLIDSVMQYWKVYQSLQKDSSALQFSIDSLSKMK